MTATVDTPTTSTAPIRKPGRPRSAQAHQAILDATLALLVEEGYQGMSLEAVAARAGVGKTTIYRRWASKEQLVVDMLASLDTNPHFHETGDLRADLIAHLRRELDPNTNPVMRRLLFRLMGELIENPELFAVYRERVIEPQMRELTEAVNRAVARGELRPDVDPEMLLEMVGGPIAFHLILTGKMNFPPDMPDRLVGALWNGIAAKQ